MGLQMQNAAPKPNGISQYVLVCSHQCHSFPSPLKTNRAYNHLCATLHQLSNGTVQAGYAIRLLLLLADQQLRLPHFSHFQFFP